jgi:hypothetical protein
MEEATSSNSSDDDVVVMEEVTVEQAPDLLDMQQRFNQLSSNRHNNKQPED